MGHDNCGCEEAQAGVRHAIAEMAASRARLQAAISKLKAVDREAREARMPTETTAQAQAAAMEQAWAPATTDTTLLQSALEEAGRINQTQAKMIEDQREALVLAAETMYSQRGELANWQIRYQSAADRLSEHWPTDPEIKKLRLWLTELKALLDTTMEELKEAREEAKGWRDRFYGSYQPGAPVFSEGPVAPVTLAPAADTDEEMLG